jgi:hypothetical protein
MMIYVIQEIFTQWHSITSQNYFPNGHSITSQNYSLIDGALQDYLPIDTEQHCRTACLVTKHHFPELCTQWQYHIPELCTQWQHHIPELCTQWHCHIPKLCTQWHSVTSQNCALSGTMSHPRTTCQVAQCHITEDLNFQKCCYEDLRHCDDCMLKHVMKH